MKWSLLELKKHQETPLYFSETLALKADLLERDNQILDVAPVKVDGFITVNKTEYLVHYTAETVLTVPSSRSLEPVALPLELSVDELFMTPEQYQSRSELISEEEVLLIEGQTIDLNESVMDNLLLAIPLQVLTEEEMKSTDLPKGQDWEVVSEADFARQREEQAASTIDPRLAKLSQLLDENPMEDEE